MAEQAIETASLITAEPGAPGPRIWGSKQRHQHDHDPTGVLEFFHSRHSFCGKSTNHGAIVKISR